MGILRFFCAFSIAMMFLLLLSGCDDNETDGDGDGDADADGDSDGDGDGDGDADGDSDGDSDGDGDGDADGDADGDGDADQPLNILEVSPDDGSMGVPLDRTIAISFNQRLDPESVGEDSVVVTSSRGPAVGEVRVRGALLTFMPALYVANLAYTVTVTTDVTSETGRSLEAPYIWTFNTGALMADGSEPPLTGVNPLLPPRFAHITRKVELAVLGVDWTQEGESNVFVVDSDEHDPALSRPDGEQNNVVAEMNDTSLEDGVHRRGTAAALDDDFREEIAAVIWGVHDEGELVIYDVEGGAMSASRPTIDLSIGSDLGLEYTYTIATADVEADGYDELVITGHAGGTGHLWVLDDGEHGYALLHEREIPGARALDATGADLDADRRDEIAVVSSACEGGHDITVLVIEQGPTGFAELSELTATSRVPMNESVLAIEGGELNGAPGEELVVGERTLLINSTYTEYTVAPQVHVLGLSEDTLEVIAAEPTFLTIYHVPASPAPTSQPHSRALEVGDFDGDDLDEIFFGRFFIDDVSASGGSLSTIPHFPGSTSLGLTHYLHETMSGDFDGDGRDDVLLYQDRTGEPMFNEDTGRLLTYQGEGDTARYEERSEVFGPRLSLPRNYILIGANVDDDSMVLTQAVDSDGFPTEVSHHQFFRDPLVIAAIAGPPCREEIGQNCNACSTGLGTYNGTTYTGGVSLSVRAGVVVGFLYEEDFSLAYGIGTSWTVAALHHTTEFGLEFAATYSYSFTREETITYNAGCGEDLVVFSSTPVQRFIYTVATLPEDTENHDELVGREMVVDVPLTPRVSAVSREYYNENNGDWPDIGPEVIPNTPGVLETYPNYEEAIAILGMYDEIDRTEAVPIGLGNGFTTRSLSLTTENFVGLSLSAYLDSTTESCIFGICAGYSVGYGLGGFFEVTFTEGTEFSCSVSHIPEEHFAENYFSYGLFAYTMDLPGADSEHPAPPLTVLNYYIE